jgi:small subunit ribosomal protein S6
VRERIRNYELVFIISPLHADDEGIERVVTHIEDAVSNERGSVTGVNRSAPWGRRKFAYPIRAYAGGEASRRVFTEGYYILMNLSLPSTRVSSLERTLKLTDPVLRHLITLVEDGASSVSGRNGASAEAGEDIEAEAGEDIEAEAGEDIEAEDDDEGIEAEDDDEDIEAEDDGEDIEAEDDDEGIEAEDDDEDKEEDGKRA